MITPVYGTTATERILPRLALDFTTAILDSRVSVSRALNTATAVNSSGYVQIINANQPRFDYDPSTLFCKGILIEESRTNVCIQGSDFSAIAWTATNVSIGNNSTQSPDGAITGDTILASAGSSVHRVFGTAATVGAGVVITHSVYLKSGTNNFAQIHDTGTGTYYANFDLSNGSVTAVNPANSATITPFANGWYRCTLTMTTGSATCGAAVAVIPSGSSTRNPTWTAAGTESVYAWGYQIEVGSFATSYIPTTTIALTRNADDVSMTGTNFSGWYNQSQGAFVIDFDTNIVSASGVIGYAPLSVSDGTSLNIMYPYVYATVLGMKVISGGVSQAEIFPSGTPANNTPLKIIFAYKTNDLAATSNGAAPVTASSMTVPTVNQLGIGSRPSTPQINGHVRSIRYWPQRIINAETQSFSK